MEMGEDGICFFVSADWVILDMVLEDVTEL